MAKRQKTTRFSIQTYDDAHYRQTEAYTRAIDALFDRATKAIAVAAAKGKYNPDKPFLFDDYPSAKAVMQDVTRQLASRMITTIETGSRKQWLFACDKNDGFVESIMDTSKLSKARLKKLQDRNLEALKAFQGRKVDGMNLSQRVWKYVGQYKEQLESALDVGLGDGRSAQQLARDVKLNLNEPNRLFRRVRDKRGNLVLSKAARAYHPGRGVYRSSVKNAQRLTRSEINMAYRESDWRRWQSLDFVVGFEIRRSNHEPLCDCDLCEKLVGRYPKTFKFKGWHPQCMCYAVPILMDEETFDDNELGDLKAALNGTTYKKMEAKNVVVDVPDGFKQWVKDHMDAQANWGSTPYFIKDNFKDGKLSKGLKIALPTASNSGKLDYHVPFEDLTNEEKRNFNNEMINRVADDWDLVSACKLYGIDASWYDKMSDDIANNNEYWRLSELNAERDKLKSMLMAKIQEYKNMSEKAISDYKIALDASLTWVGNNDIVERARQMMADESVEKYPNYMAVYNSSKGGILDVSKLRTSIESAKANYNQAILDAKALVDKYDGKIDISRLKSLINEDRTEKRNAVVITKDIKKEITDVEAKWKALQDGYCSGNIEELEKLKITYRQVGKHKEELSFEEIIQRVGGGDKTSGSCASVGLAYAANKGGYDVLDFRDGDSRKYFASHIHIRQFVDKLGGITRTNSGKDKISGMELMRGTEIGKEYYLAIDRHAAIVRQTSKGKYEYLELQSAYNNGWHPLNAKVFGWRFGARGRTWHYEMIEISKLYNDDSFIKMMGYINTSETEQKKGKSGTIK